MDRVLTVELKVPHAKQRAFIDSTAKRKIIRAGRRGGKTMGAAMLAVNRFLAGHRILYATPTEDQITSFWYEVKRALAEPIDAGVYKKNETMHIIELEKTKQRIRAKTAYNADTLRGDYCNVLILDEWQLMNEEAWEVVGAPMMLDHNGDAIFIYTPPSLHSRSVSKASDPQHAAKMFKKAQTDTSGRWAAFHFTSHDNPYLNKEALADITRDMTNLAYRMEVMAEDVDEVPGALWTRAILDANRMDKAPQDDKGLSLLGRVVVAIDPSITSEGDEAGIIGVGCKGNHLYTLADRSLQGSPLAWAKQAVALYWELSADCIVAEANQGGEMVSQTIHNVQGAGNIPVRLVHASRGKQTRAEPVAAVYEQGRGHHVGNFPALEDEMCLWLPGDLSPNRMDALVWGASELLQIGEMEVVEDPFATW